MSIAMQVFSALILMGILSAILLSRQVLLKILARLEEVEKKLEA